MLLVHRMVRLGFLILFLRVYTLAGYARVCFYTNWSQYRTGAGKFTPRHIDPHLCTHIVYTFARVDGADIKPTESNDLEHYKQVVALKEQNPSLKVLISVGGWTNLLNSVSPLLKIFSDERTIEVFMENCIKFMNHYKFDGLDFNLEFSSEENNQTRMKTIFKTIKTNFANQNSSTFLLSATIPDNFHNDIDLTTDNHLDMLNLKLPYSMMTNLTTIDNWVDSLLQRKDKVSIVLPMFGMTISSKNTKQPGNEGPLTKEKGYLSYQEICIEMKTVNNISSFNGSDNNETLVTTKNIGNMIVRYLSAQGVANIITGIIKTDKLMGVGFWSLDVDDFTGDQCNSGKFPLLRATEPEPVKPTQDSLATSTTYKYVLPCLAIGQYYGNVAMNQWCTDNCNSGRSCPHLKCLCPQT